MSNKTAIVTGGTKGVGAAIARRLAKLGFALVLSARSDEEVPAIEALRQGGADVRVVKADVRRRGEVEQLFETATALFGEIGVVCANAGVEDDATSFVDMREEDLDRIVDTNVKGTFFTLQQAARRIADGGRVIVTGSTIARYPPANASVYAGSKAAVNLMTEVLALELAARGVTVNTIDPGMVADAGIVADMPAERLAELTKTVPMGRMLRTADLEGLIGFLVSDEASMITGQHLAVTGGSRP